MWLRDPLLHLTVSVSLHSSLVLPGSQQYPAVRLVVQKNQSLYLGTSKHKLMHFWVMKRMLSSARLLVLAVEGAYALTDATARMKARKSMAKRYCVEQIEFFAIGIYYDFKFDHSCKRLI